MTDQIIQKLCKKCNQEKPLSEYKILVRTIKEGPRKYLNSQCNECVKLFHKSYYNKVSQTPKYKERKKKNYNYVSTGKPRGRPKSAIIDQLNTV